MAGDMIITNDFVLINFPKTGSTFARQIITDLYLKKLKRNRIQKLANMLGVRKNYFLRELFLPKTEYLTEKGDQEDQHGRYVQMPEEFRQKPVLSVVRDPVVRNISFYEFGWWKRYYAAPLEEIKKLFPTFPDIDFQTYLKFQKYNSRYRDTGTDINDDIGEQTVQFIQYFFKRPREVFAKLNDEYIYSGVYRQDLPDMTLLTTETLNSDLYKYLLGCGFSRKEVGIVTTKGPVRPEQTKRKTEKERSAYLTDDLIRTIRHSERYLYRIYSDYGIVY